MVIADDLNPQVLLERMPPPEDDSDKRSTWVQLAKYSQLAFIFPAATIVGWLIGAGLDRWLHTSWLYLVGLILGIVAGFVELIRAAMSDAN
ncbi:MAG: AtpZ/AtpI family protein [Terriglobales bacterium]